MQSDRARLRAIAVRAMRERGLEPDFPERALFEVSHLPSAPVGDGSARDLRRELWCSIDNDESRDLDQLSVVGRRGNGVSTVFVAIADVDSLVDRGSAIDRHAALNTTSVYTPAVIFPMLPERLSTDLTSLGPDVDRLAIVVELTISANGSLQGSNVYRAAVHNHAKLTYREVDDFLAGSGRVPPAVASVEGMDLQLRIQDEAAQALGRARHD